VAKFGNEIHTRFHESTSVFYQKDCNTLFYFTKGNLFDGQKTVKDKRAVCYVPKIFKATKENGYGTPN